MSADHSAEAKALASGAARFLPKPLQKDTLLNALREVAAG